MSEMIFDHYDPLTKLVRPQETRTPKEPQDLAKYFNALGRYARSSPNPTFAADPQIRSHRPDRPKLRLPLNEGPKRCHATRVTG
jgi:hypothetical protein